MDAESTPAHHPADLVVFILNDPFVDELGEQGVQRYVAALAGVAERSRGSSEDDIAAALEEAFSESAQPPHSVELHRMAEKLARPGWKTLVVQTSSGRVLFGPDVDLGLLVESNPNPADPERGAYEF